MTSLVLGRNRERRQRSSEALLATHLTLICHGATRAMREGAFADPNEPLDDGSQRKLAQFRLSGPEPDRLLTSGALAARQTAARLGPAPEIEEAIRDADAGAWRGRSIADLYVSEPGALESWLADPTKAAPGGEAMDAVAVRLGRWLDQVSGSDVRIVAVSHAAILRAAIAVVLDAPIASAMNIDIAPLTAVRLSCNRKWRLQEIASR